MNKYLKIGIFIIIVISIGSIVLLTNPIIKFKVESLFTYKECEVTDFDISHISKYDYECSDYDDYSSSFVRRICRDDVDFDKILLLKGSTNCNAVTKFNFIIFSESNKFITRGNIYVNGNFKEIVHTGVEWWSYDSDVLFK
jgi:hypothetical protein